MRRARERRWRWAAMGPLLLAACFDEPPATSTVVTPPPFRGQGGGGGALAGPVSPLPVCAEGTQEACARPELIAAGGYHTCVAMSDGTVRCFGANGSYQLGDPATPQGAFQGTRIVASVRHPRALIAGRQHHCAVLEDGAVRCWGRNSLGQLGTGDTDFAPTPRANGVKAVMGSAIDATCVVDDLGGVRCWSVLLNGQGWDRYFGEFSPAPTAVEFAAPVEQLAVASRHACAVWSGGERVQCWGRDAFYALGRGFEGSSPSPVDVSSTLRTPVRLISGAGERTCVVGGEPEQVQCWGRQRAAGNWQEPTALPVQPDGHIVDLEVGWSHSCVLLEGGRVQCWGLNHQEGLGIAGGDRADPVYVTGIDDAVALAVGASHSCVIRRSGAVACWGTNHLGALGLPPNVASSWQPVSVDLEVSP